MGVKGLKDGDGMFISCPKFINECAACDFEGFGKETSGEDERYEALELLEPDRMEAGEEVEGEAAKSGFGRNMFDGVMEGWECCGEVYFGG